MPWHWFDPALGRIATERRQLQEKLATLPPAPAPHVTQRLGWHSLYSASPEAVEWIELNLGRAERLDAVVLIAPAPLAGGQPVGYGFPRRFRVELLGDDEDATRTVIADHTGEDFPNPGLLPVFIPTGGRPAQRVRITATRLFREDQRYLAALGEIILLQGPRNLSPQLEVIGPAAVRASSSQGTRPDWGRINLVDGHSALGPPLGARPSPTLGFHSVPKSESRAPENPWVKLDLGRPVPIEEVRLFPAHPPQFAHSQGYGFPVHYQIELRANADDTPTILPAPQSGSYSAPPGDNVVTVVAPGTTARFVRLAVLEPHVSNGSVVLALAEMEVWSRGKNVAPGSTVQASNSIEKEGWSRPALIDGFTSSADIADWPGWLGGLSQRRETLHKLAALDAQQAARLTRWKTIAGTGLGALLAATLLVLAAAYLRQRRARQRELEGLRQRIARDLHDEIGSSLGSIALIAQDLLATNGSAPSTREDLQEIKGIADETVSAMRDITRLIQSDRYGHDDLPTLLRETAARLLRGITHSIETEAAPDASKLPVDRQRDLILMFKETLHNITHHAAATAVDIRLSQNSTRLAVSIRDNGRGFDPSTPVEGMGLTNLQRRAAKHGGRVEIQSASGRGTTIRITLPCHV